MKKKLIITASSLLIIASGIFSSMKTVTEKPVNKSINVQVYKAASYISPAYADAYAKLQITIVKTNGNKRDTTWQHNFAPKQLKDFPTSDKPMLQKITIPNVNDSKEKLEIYYRLTYSTKGSELNFSDATIIGKGEQNGKLNIKI